MTDPTAKFETDDVTLLREAHSGYEQLRQRIATVIVGQRQVVRSLLASVFAQGHVLIIGVPGLGKTLLVKTLAQSLGWQFKRIQFTPDMMPSDIIGMELLHDDRVTGSRSMKFTPGPIFANLILADEINRTPPKTQAALLEAMQERTVTSMGRTHVLERPFVVVATQNPIEQEGTYPLPEAQLDRFMFSLRMDYPSVQHEEQIVAMPLFDTTQVVEPGGPEEPGEPGAGGPGGAVFSREQMVLFGGLVGRVPVSKHVVSYAVAITRATRPGSAGADDYVNRFVQWGAGPRAGQHMIQAARAFAVLDGQPTVAARHVREAAPLVLCHRVIANYHATAEGNDAVKIVRHVIEQIKEPTYT